MWQQFARKQQQKRCARLHWRIAFTIVELLVVIAIVALLVALLLPALGKAKSAAREAVCLSNHRQLGVAWVSYSNDYGVFPFRDNSVVYQLVWGWGGVDWYPATGQVPGLNLAADRPLNAYVAPSDTVEFRANVFKCPLDTGAHNWRTGMRSWDSLGITSTSGETTTCFGVAGTSYQANLWMYCKPGATGGWGTGANAGINYRPGQGPQHVYVSPSRFVMLSDIGPSNWVVSTIAQRNLYDFWGEWWHGTERGSFTFLDGSARVEKSGRLVSSSYSMHMLDVPNANSGYLWPNHAP